MHSFFLSLLIPSHPPTYPKTLNTAPQAPGVREKASIPTIRMPHLAQKAHRGRVKRIVLWEFQLGGEDAAFKGGAVGALDEGFPEEDVVFGDGAGGDAVGGGGGEEFVFVEEAAGCDCGGHGGGGGF